MKKKLLKLTALILVALLTLSGCSVKRKNLVILEENFGSEDYGIAFRKEDKALGMEVQKELDAMVENGTIKTISEKWFGSDVYLKDTPLLNEDNEADDNSLINLQKRGKFILGLDANFPPMGFVDSNTKEIVGFDIDLAREVCKRMGVELVIKPIVWEEMESELSAGKVDCIWNGMTILPDRLENMYIPKAYLKNRQIIVTRDSTGIKTKADLAGKIVGVQKGSASADVLKEDKITADSVKEIVELADFVSVFMELKAKRVDAVVVDEATGLYIIAEKFK